MSGGYAKKFIVVTGCSRGCGRALVEWLIGKGHMVAGCARSEKELAVLRKQCGTAHRFDAVDVTDAAAVSQWGRALSLHTARRISW